MYLGIVCNIKKFFFIYKLLYSLKKKQKLFELASLVFIFSYIGQDMISTLNKHCAHCKGAKKAAETHIDQWLSQTTHAQNFVFL